jgi:hypothetical protein
MNSDWTNTISQLVHVDVERRTIDAAPWLASIPVWYRAAAAGIVQHWAGILELSCVRAGTPAEWILDIRHAARHLTPPCVGAARARGIIEWRHPQDRLSDDPIYGLCWVDRVDGTSLCWTHLANLACLGGCHTTRELTDITPLGCAAEEIVALLHYQIALQS